jgi:hypothetical protein
MNIPFLSQGIMVSLGISGLKTGSWWQHIPSKDWYHMPNYMVL